MRTVRTNAGAVIFRTKMLKRRPGMTSSYRVLLNSSFILALFIYLLAIPNLSLAANVGVFEETFVRGKGKPQTQQRNFTAVAGEGSLIIHNGNANGKNRVSSAVIILNGSQVVGPNEFNQQVGLIEKPVVLNLNDTLEVQLRSAPGSLINVQILRKTSGNEITQTFTDLKPTKPRPEEITAPPVDLDTSFAPPGPPVIPGPPGEVDSDLLEDQEGAASQPTVMNSAGTEGTINQTPKCDPAVQEGCWIGKDEGVPTTVPPGQKPGEGYTAIHAALLRTKATATEDDSGAEILWFAGDGNDPTGSETGKVDHTGVFQIVKQSRDVPIEEQFKVEKISCPKCPQLQNPAPNAKTTTADLFCAGHALLEDGRLLVAGGTEFFPQTNPSPSPHGEIHHHTAIRDSFIFDPKTNTWSKSFPMNFNPGPNFEQGTQGGGRWYPSLLTLNSGQVLAFWGHPANDDPRHTNNTPEIFSLETSKWQFLGRETDVPQFAFFDVLEDGNCKLVGTSAGYPRVHLLPNGRVFRAQAVPDPDNTESTRNVEINPIPESLTDRDEISVKVSSGPSNGHNVRGDNTFSSVLLPLTPDNNYRARVLLTGGGIGAKKDAQGNVVRDSCGHPGHPRADVNIPVQPELIDLGTDESAFFKSAWTRKTEWKRDPAIAAKPRHQANATILPTGEVFVSGGQTVFFGDVATTGVLQGEIYNPFSKDPEKEWRTVASANVPRAYHSVASLMPDGRVWHAGTTPETDVRVEEERVEIYEPWYYSKTRPVIREMKGPEDPIYPGGIVMHPHDRGLTQVVVDHFRDVKKFVLVRAGSDTHAFNPDQRYIDLGRPVLLDSDFSTNTPRFKYSFTSPPSTSIAPPGNYLLFAIDDRGVPSVGRFIRLDREFVGELFLEAEDFTSAGTSGNRRGISVNDDGTVFLEHRGSDLPSVGPVPTLQYGGVDFGTEGGVVKEFSAYHSSSTGRGILNVRQDKPDGPLIAQLEVTDTNGVTGERVTPVAPVSGVHNVFIQFYSPIPDFTARVIVDWFKFK